uniref:Uncharacterized protein n=1 Tax=Knipowitschia caucasica TaxID=637954 RepID=A0AAV2IWG5_KNICA
MYPVLMLVEAQSELEVRWISRKRRLGCSGRGRERGGAEITAPYCGEDGHSRQYKGRVQAQDVRRRREQRVG